MNLPMATVATPAAERPRTPEELADLQAEVRALARERDAIILATTTSCPRSRTSPTSWATRSRCPSAPPGLTRP